MQFARDLLGPSPSHTHILVDWAAARILCTWDTDEVTHDDIVRLSRYGALSTQKAPHGMSISLYALASESPFVGDPSAQSRRIDASLRLWAVALYDAQLSWDICTPAKRIKRNLRPQTTHLERWLALTKSEVTSAPRPVTSEKDGAAVSVVAGSQGITYISRSTPRIIARSHIQTLLEHVPKQPRLSFLIVDSHPSVRLSLYSECIGMALQHYEVAPRKAPRHKTPSLFQHKAPPISQRKTPPISQPRNATSRDSLPLSLTKNDLHALHVIGQADAKYIVCSLGRRLVCIDQHAAHERIRLEHIMQCALRDGPVELVEPVLVGHLPPEVRRELARWRVCVRGTQVTHVPGIFADELQNASHVQSLADDIKVQCDAQLRGDGQLQTSDLVWPQAYAEFPQTLRALADARACRGAIKFNEELSRAGCMRLVDALRVAVHPFTCAHGRPVLVILAEYYT